MNKRIDDALAALNNATQLKDILNSIDLFNDNYETRMLAIVENNSTSKDSDYVNSLRAHMNTLPMITRSTNARKLFIEIEELKNRIFLALAYRVDQVAYIDEFIKEIDVFAETYNSYAVHNNNTNALPLIKSANIIKRSINSLQGLLGYFRFDASILAMREHEARFTLLLVRVLNLKDFADKLLRIESLYSEICGLFDISVAEYPLRISKIESGSLWADFFGHIKVIEFMTSTVEKAVKYLHRNYTNEGKISAIPKQIESLESILDFTNRLKDSGVDVTAIHETLAKSTITIANDLNIILSGQPKVLINGEEISLGDEAYKALLGNESTKRIEYRSPINDNTKTNKDLSN